MLRHESHDMHVCNAWPPHPCCCVNMLRAAAASTLTPSPRDTTAGSCGTSSRCQHRRARGAAQSAEAARNEHTHALSQERQKTLTHPLTLKPLSRSQAGGPMGSSSTRLTFRSMRLERQVHAQSSSSPPRAQFLFFSFLFFFACKTLETCRRDVFTRRAGRTRAGSQSWRCRWPPRR